MSIFSFAPGKIICTSEGYKPDEKPAAYTMDGENVLITFDLAGKTRQLSIAPVNPFYAAALAAVPASVQAPTPAPVQAREPVEKPWIGEKIQGRGWKILFDGSYDRTRVIFDHVPSQAQKDLVKAAGFFWSPQLKSWNKKLTCKAYRAAQALNDQLWKLYEGRPA